MQLSAFASSSTTATASASSSSPIVGLHNIRRGLSSRCEHRPSHAINTALLLPRAPRPCSPQRVPSACRVARSKDGVGPGASDGRMGWDGYELTRGCGSIRDTRVAHTVPSASVPEGGTKPAVSAIFRLARCRATLNERGNPGVYRTVDHMRLHAPSFAVPQAAASRGSGPALALAGRGVRRHRRRRPARTVWLLRRLCRFICNCKLLRWRSTGDGRSGMWAVSAPLLRGPSHGGCVALDIRWTYHVRTCSWVRALSSAGCSRRPPGQTECSRLAVTGDNVHDSHLSLSPFYPRTRRRSMSTAGWPAC
jgi:hypothetical protein